MKIVKKMLVTAIALSFTHLSSADDTNMSLDDAFNKYYKENKEIDFENELLDKKEVITQKKMRDIKNHNEYLADLINNRQLLQELNGQNLSVKSLEEEFKSLESVRAEYHEEDSILSENDELDYSSQDYGVDYLPPAKTKNYSHAYNNIKQNEFMEAPKENNVKIEDIEKTIQKALEARFKVSDEERRKELELLRLEQEKINSGLQVSNMNNSIGEMDNSENYNPDYIPNSNSASIRYDEYLKFMDDASIKLTIVPKVDGIAQVDDVVRASNLKVGDSISLINDVVVTVLNLDKRLVKLKVEDKEHNKTTIRNINLNSD